MSASHFVQVEPLGCGVTTLRSSMRSFTRWNMAVILGRLWLDDAGQDIAEYAVMLAVILVIVVGSIRLIGANANNVFSAVSSSLQ
jgi:Flp pilus assembly pilin Flp